MDDFRYRNINPWTCSAFLTPVDNFGYRNMNPWTFAVYSTPMDNFGYRNMSLIIFLTQMDKWKVYIVASLYLSCREFFWILKRTEMIVLLNGEFDLSSPYIDSDRTWVNIYTSYKPNGRTNFKKKVLLRLFLFVEYQKKWH